MQNTFKFWQACCPRARRSRYSLQFGIFCKHPLSRFIKSFKVKIVSVQITQEGTSSSLKIGTLFTKETCQAYVVRSKVANKYKVFLSKSLMLLRLHNSLSCRYVALDFEQFCQFNDKQYIIGKPFQIANKIANNLLKLKMNSIVFQIKSCNFF